MPQQLFDKPLAPTAIYDFGYRPSADGKKFLTLAEPEGESAAVAPVTIRMNWQAGLKK